MVLNYYFLENKDLKKVAHTFFMIKFYLKFLRVAGYFNIHKYTNYNIIIEIDINRLSTTAQIFIAMDYSILVSEKYFLFRKKQMHLAKTFFPTP